MKYIDKQLYEKEADSLIYDFLVEAWNEEFQEYIGLDYYDGFNKRQYREKFENILRNEQYQHCCYCMRNIRKRKITIEHIIPYKCNDAIDGYTSYSYILSNKVELLKDFITKPLPPSNKPYKQPHIIAHVNLTASCMGIAYENSKTGCFCNNKRLNNKIVPLMLVQNCMLKVGYQKDGRMFSRVPDDENYKKTINFLNLNHERLIEIRFLWCRIWEKRLLFDWLKSNTEIKRQISIIKALGYRRWSEVPEEYKKYKIDFYWELLIDYKWFHQYYRNEETYNN